MVLLKKRALQLAAAKNGADDARATATGSTTKTLTTQQKLNRTIAIMPFLGYEMGAGHSNLGNRFVYLQACFWSIFPYMPHIVAYVKSEKVGISIGIEL